ncbi:MAG: nucleotidyltransferase domain-containing protein, partial [Candidatus Odinarchaeia archaeon]
TLREKAKLIMKTLTENNIQGFLHGSLVRGDVNKKSDIDIVILDKIPSFEIELALSKRYEILEKEIIQATPNHPIKGHIHLDLNTTITFPLSRFSEREYNFYKFGGVMNLDELIKEIRKPGVNKKLLLIKPTHYGHLEFPIINQENRAAKILGLNTIIISERIRVLTKRDNKGRTGIFLKVKLLRDEVFEDKLKKIADRNPAVRHRIKRR